MKIKNKLKGESKEKTEHQLKYHTKNLLSMTSTNSKVQKYDQYIYPKDTREGFRILESFHYPVK